MQRSSKILIGFAAAAITYLSLLQFAGHRNMGYSGFRAYGGHKQIKCERFHKEDAEKTTPETLKQEEAQVNPTTNNNY